MRTSNATQSLTRRIINDPTFNRLLIWWHQSGNRPQTHSIHCLGEGRHNDIPLTVAEAKMLGVPLQDDWGQWFYFSDLVKTIMEAKS